MTGRASCVFAAVLVVVSPTFVAGQQNPPEEAPPGAIVVGPVTVTPAFALKDVGIDDNVFNEPVDPKSDFTFTMSPRATVALRVRRFRVSFIGSTDYIYYRRYPSERGTNVGSEVRLEGDLGRFRPYASLAGANTRSRLNTEVDERARHHDTVYSAGLAVRVASRTDVLLAVRRSSVDYEPDSTFRGVSLERSFDGPVERIEGGLGFELTPITTFSIIAHREQQRFDVSPSRDSNSWRIAPTLTFNSFGLLTGSASFGYRHFDALDPALPDYSGLVASAAIGATIYGRHQLQTAYTRDVQYSYDPSTPYYLANGGSLTWTTVVVGPFDVRGTLGRYQMHYRGAGEPGDTDTSANVGGGVGYRFGERARLGLNADWARRESERSSQREFRNRRIFASLTWGTL